MKALERPRHQLVGSAHATILTMTEGERLDLLINAQRNASFGKGSTFGLGVVVGYFESSANRLISTISRVLYIFESIVHFSKCVAKCLLSQ